MVKVCSRCGKGKSQDQYYRRSGTQDGLQYWCKTCVHERARERMQDPVKREKRNAWRRENAPYVREARVLYLYRLTPEQMELLLSEQGGVCAICGTKEPGGRWNTWHIDHDHSCCPTKKGRTCGKCIRGILCHSCNLMIGCANDDPERLHRAITYLTS